MYYSRYTDVAYTRERLSEVRDQTLVPKTGSPNSDPCISGHSEIMKEEELVFIKAHIVELPATALRQLRREILQERRRREAEASAKAKESGDRSTVHKEEAPALLQTAPRAAVGKRKANELDSSDSGGSMEPATRRPASGPKPGVGSAPLPTQAKGAPALAPENSTGEQPVSSGRQLSYAEASKPSGTLKPTAKGTGNAAVPAASKDAAPRRTSAGPSGSVPGPLSGKHEDITFTAAQVGGRVPPGERRNKTPVYVSGVRNTRKFLAWIRENTASKLLAQMRGETLKLVPDTADGFRATIGTLRSFGEDKGVSFQTFSFPEDRCVRLLLKNAGKRMPEAEIREELEALSISVQAVMQLRSKLAAYQPTNQKAN
jgi:hypothetical protein